MLFPSLLFNQRLAFFLAQQMLFPSLLLLSMSRRSKAQARLLLQVYQQRTLGTLTTLLFLLSALALKISVQRGSTSLGAQHQLGSTQASLAQFNSAMLFHDQSTVAISSSA
jgi:hypothetical protein